MQAPKQITAGTQVSWDFSDDRAGDFIYYLRGPGAYQLAGTAENGLVSVTASTATTADWLPGRYEWRLYLLQDGERLQLAAGQLTVEADFTAQTGGLDVRSYARRMLDAIEATLEGRVVSDHEKYTIDGRSLDRIPIVELERLRRRYKRTVLREEGGSPAMVPGRVRTRLPG